MASLTNTNDSIEKLKNTLNEMKTPLKFNLLRINEILDLFDKTTSALINPIKKLKIFCSSKLENLTEKEENGKRKLIKIKKY
jgi:hypothetical protein